MGRTGNKGQNTKVRVTKRYSLSRKRSGVELFELFLYQKGTALQAPRGYPARDQVQREKMSIRGAPGLGPMPVGVRGTSVLRSLVGALQSTRQGAGAVPEQ